MAKLVYDKPALIGLQEKTNGGPPAPISPPTPIPKQQPSGSDCVNGSSPSTYMAQAGCSSGMTAGMTCGQGLGQYS